ncbi:TetR/AcrR family transcriptional regulator C-terminal domain-containing protein [Leifsonia sp. fls2-241-R2A-40a]|uniref:TetR/AcrR family transcriptional regulator C-terminal domain-containing protein n=1 Tax=Leifsonia sp. fls2-241-R2A-40a TaxID=3040290 RepID=UPI0025514868|nr:TetR/AcrR family transcriptional regulator C-terminal domain-containing protein [Leifsonia sp. fls2-241-R2A-40a]
MSSESTPRVTLSADRVIDAAIELADREGLEGLSMRALAQGFGVVPMALYKHVANKDDLLDGMVDRVWAEVEAPQPELGWREAMRRRSISLRAAMLRHRWAVGMMEARMRPGLSNLHQHNAMMGCLRLSGFSFRTTVHVTSVLDAYVYGFALQEKTLPFGTPEESGEVAAQKLEATPPEFAQHFPHLLEVVSELARSGYDYDEEFLTGLDLILDGVERLRPEWATADARADATSG